MNSELQVLEFPEAVRLIQGGARTALARVALGAMDPWDGLAGLRRLYQLELQEAWAAAPDQLPVLAMDEALEELLNPAGWLLPVHWRELREGLRALSRLLQALAQLPPVFRQQPPRGVEQLLQGLVHGQHRQLGRRGRPGFLQLQLIEAAQPRPAIPGIHGAQGRPRRRRPRPALNEPDRFGEFKHLQFRVHGSGRSLPPPVNQKGPLSRALL